MKTVVASVFSIVAIVVLPVAAGVVSDPGTVDGGPAEELVIPMALPGMVTESLDSGYPPPPLETAVMWGIANPEPEAVARAKAAVHTPASVTLANLDTAARLNAVVQLEPVNAEAEASMVHAAGAASSWNSGNFELALVTLEQIEAGGSEYAVGIAWREPIPSGAPEWYLDVRIGTDDNAEDVALDYHRATGNIFVVVSWGNDLGTDWGLYMSQDGGVSFVETFSYNGSPNPLVDLVVVQDFVYVSYTDFSGTSAEEARFRRHSAITGASDTGYGFHTVADVGPDTIVDISAGANTDDTDNRIYMGFIDSANNLGFFWDDPVDGTTFGDISPAGSAQDGLDYHWNTASPTSSYRWISYLGTDGMVHAAGLSAGTDTALHAYTGTGFQDRIRVSAHRDNIFVAYEESYTNGMGAYYNISYNGGASFDFGTFAPAAGEPPNYNPDVSARSGFGSAMIYNEEAGTTDGVFHIQRSGYAPGAWTDEFDFSNHDAQSGSVTVIEWIGSLCVSSYGLVYLAGDFDPIPYFDLITPRGFFCDDFESGGTGSWSITSP